MNSTPAASTRLGWPWPLALGLLGFFLVVGPRALDPTNIAWLELGDPATYYLGWLFYRQAPWQFPIGLNPSYGLELGNAIFYADANTLAAFLFKPFSSLLPGTFQYLGIWSLVCFVLQAWFAWKLVGLLTGSRLIRLLGAGLFVFAPPMLWRLHGHYSLASHFLIIAALYLALKPGVERRRLAWAALLVCTAWVHAYLLAMVAAIWVADLGTRTARRHSPLRHSVPELLLLTGLTGLACWQAGYFSIGSGVSTGGYGLYRMNLLSVIDANGWSYLLPGLSSAEPDYENFNYLGLGTLLLLLVAIGALVSRRATLAAALGRHRCLVLLLGLFTLYAASNNVAVGPIEFSYPLPDAVTRLANIFRSSARMFWPVFYALLFAALFLVIKGFSRRTATGVLLAALVIQVVDTSAGWLPMRHSLMTKADSQWASPLTDPFWADAANRYSKVRHIPAGNLPPHWQTLAFYAGRHGLATDAVYLARVGQSAADHARQNAIATLVNGQYEPDALYILDDEHARVAAMTTHDQHLLAHIDGFNVLAPGWQGCATCGPVAADRHIRNRVPPLRAGEQLMFNTAGTAVDYLGAGWSTPEDWGVWSEGSDALIFLPIAPAQVSSLVIEARALISPSHTRQRVTLTVNDVPVGSVDLSASATTFEVQLPEALQQAPETEHIRLALHLPDAARPKDLGLGEDPRKLALGLVTLTLNLNAGAEATQTTAR